MKNPCFATVGLIVMISMIVLSIIKIANPDTPMTTAHCPSLGPQLQELTRLGYVEIWFDSKWNNDWVVKYGSRSAIMPGQTTVEVRSTKHDLCEAVEDVYFRVLDLNLPTEILRRNKP